MTYTLECPNLVIGAEGTQRIPSGFMNAAYQLILWARNNGVKPPHIDCLLALYPSAEEVTAAGTSTIINKETGEVKHDPVTIAYRNLAARLQMLKNTKYPDLVG